MFYAQIIKTGVLLFDKYRINLALLAYGNCLNSRKVNWLKTGNLVNKTYFPTLKAILSEFPVYIKLEDN